MGSAVKANARVMPGSLNPGDVTVQLYRVSMDKDREVVRGSIEEMRCIGRTDEGMHTYEAYIGCDESGMFEYSIRVMPNHPDMVDHFGLEKMLWIDGRRKSAEMQEASRSEDLGVC